MILQVWLWTGCLVMYAATHPPAMTWDIVRVCLSHGLVIAVQAYAA